MIDRRRVMGTSGAINIAEASVGTACAGIKWKHPSGLPFKVPTEVVNLVSGYLDVTFIFKDPNGNYSFQISFIVMPDRNNITALYRYYGAWDLWDNTTGNPWITDDGEWVTISFLAYHDNVGDGMVPETPYYYDGIYSGSSTLAALLNDYVLLIPA